MRKAGEGEAFAMVWPLAAPAVCVELFVQKFKLVVPSEQDLHEQFQANPTQHPLRFIANASPSPAFRISHHYPAS